MNFLLALCSHQKNWTVAHTATICMVFFTKTLPPQHHPITLPEDGLYQGNKYATLATLVFQLIVLLIMYYEGVSVP